MELEPSTIFCCLKNEPTFLLRYIFDPPPKKPFRVTVIKVKLTLGTSGTIWNHLGPSGTIWNHLEPSGTIWNPWNHLEPSETLSRGFQKNPEGSKFFCKLRAPQGIWNPLVFSLDPPLVQLDRYASY